jgi:hypothetical protein
MVLLELMAEKNTINKSIWNTTKKMRLSQKHEAASFLFIAFGIRCNRFKASFLPSGFNIINIFNLISCLSCTFLSLPAFSAFFPCF